MSTHSALLSTAGALLCATVLSAAASAAPTSFQSNPGENPVSDVGRSRVEDWSFAIFAWENLPDWTITDVVLGVREGSLFFAKYTATAPGAAPKTFDRLDQADWIITDTLDLPERVRFMTQGGQPIYVESFSFHIDDQGRAGLETMAGAYSDGETFAYAGMSSGAGGGGPDNGVCGAPVVMGACDSYCTSSCIPVFPQSEPCHCNWNLGYCATGNAVIACPAGTCTRVCLFTRPLGLCGCFPVPSVNAPGPGGNIPASGTGGGAGTSYPAVLPPPLTEFRSIANVATQVMNVCKITIDGLNHTWIGDLQIVLYDPLGRGYNVMCRPGVASAGGFGNNGDMSVGTYEFVEYGGLPVPDTAATPMPPNTYNQHFGDENVGGIPWPNGSNNIFNMGFSAINGPPGPWTLAIYDWAGGDSGSCVSWRLEGNQNCNVAPPIVTYCTAKVNSLGCTPRIFPVGTPSATSGSGFKLISVDVLNNKSGLLFYGITGPQAIPFQNGTLCVLPPIRRTPVVVSGGNPPPNDCSGAFEIDMNEFAVGTLGGTPLPALTVPGTVVNCQWWGRDPGFAAPNNTTLSDAVEYPVGP